MVPRQPDRVYRILNCILALGLMIGVMACASDTPQQSTGALSFQAAWPQSDPQPGYRAPLDEVDVCAEHGIETIRAHVYGYGGVHGGTREWPCDTPGHTGTIDRILAGSDYRVMVEGVIDKRVAWRGQKDGITIVAGQTNSCGHIDMINVEPRFTIGASLNYGGTVEPYGNVVVNEGANQAFTIVANSGYHIEEVLIDGQSIGPVDSYVFLDVRGNHTLEAEFKLNAPVLFDCWIYASVSGAGGTITPSGTFNVERGTSVTFTIKPDNGHLIADVVVDGESQGPVPTYTLSNVDGDHTIRARFIAIRFVNGGVATPGDGTSWDQAFRTIPEAITAAVADGAGEIWVNAGRYQQGGSLQINEAVILYGGFIGTENQRGQRNPGRNATIIDGTDALHAVEISASATFDGFHVVNGGGEPDGVVVDKGGGIYLPDNADISPTIANCFVHENRADRGAGIYVGQGNAPLITGCDIEINQASVAGGGIYLYGDSNGVIVNNRIAYNSADRGAGIFNLANEVTVANTVFLSNMAESNGGGIMNQDVVVARITNCTFFDNEPLLGGAGIYNLNSSPTISNSILWHEHHSAGDLEIGNSAGSLPSVSYCSVAGGYPGTGNIDTDPLFVDRNLVQDLRLLFGSPCIDTGSNIAPGIQEPDADGAPRIVDGNDDGTETVDMGAYEYQIE